MSDSVRVDDRLLDCAKGVGRLIFSHERTCFRSY